MATSIPRGKSQSPKQPAHKILEQGNNNLSKQLKPIFNSNIRQLKHESSR